jgi:predicted amidohydrolase YtcJ
MAPPAELRAQLERWRREREVGLLSVRAVKLYADGALGSRGAALLAPYADEPASSGLLLLAPEELRSRLALVAGAGFQPAVHAIGDRACREVLDAYAAIETGKADAGGLRAQRPRIEHLQILRPEDAPRLAATGAVASMQPTHATSDGPWAEKRLGHGTPAQRGAYAWRRVLEVGAPLAFGSDFPVESPDPRLGLAAAEQRFPAGATEPWMPEQRLTRLEALRAFTGGVAYAAFAEERRGMIRVGMDGDLTAFGGDALAVPAAALPDLPIRATVVGGRVEYQGGNR